MTFEELIICFQKKTDNTSLNYQLSIPPKMLNKKLKAAAITACQNMLSETSLSMTCLFWLWYTSQAPIKENTGPCFEFQKGILMFASVNIYPVPRIWNQMYSLCFKLKTCYLSKNALIYA